MGVSARGKSVLRPRHTRGEIRDAGGGVELGMREPWRCLGGRVGWFVDSFNAGSPSRREHFGC